MSISEPPRSVVSPAPAPPARAPSVFAHSFPPERRRADAVALGLASAAGAAAYAIEPPWLRAVLLLLSALVTYVIGVFQPAPRR
jgi:hypothetical protein